MDEAKEGDVRIYVRRVWKSYWFYPNRVVSTDYVLQQFKDGEWRDVPVHDPEAK